MYFDLTDEQKMLQDSVDGWLADSSGDAAIAAHADTPPEQTDHGWRGAVELGLPSLIVPEAFGGMGMDLLTLAVVMNRFGHYAAPAPLFPHAIVSLAIALGGSDEQKATWLPKLASGEIVATFAFGEPGADGRWEPASWQLGGGRLNGTKSHVIAAQQADLLLVGIEGGRLALVEKSAPGIQLQTLDTIDTSRRTFDITFTDTPCTPLPGDVATRVRDAALVCLAADACGAAQRALDLTVEYAKTRQQFGRLIGSFQGLKYQIVNAATRQEPTRYLCWYAAHAFDAMPQESERLAALAKAHVTDVAVELGRVAVESHGGIGYTWEYPLHYFLKRAMFDRVYLGLPAVHRERVARAREW